MTDRTSRGAVEEPPGRLDAVFPEVYAEVKKLARLYLSHERRGHTLQATALVNEAYLRLRDQRNLKLTDDRTEFVFVASGMIRRVLSDYGRGRSRLKRGCPARKRLPLESVEQSSVESTCHFVAVDNALEKLERISPQLSRVVELRFFGGLTMREIADVLGVSLRKVEGDWACARAWLTRELRDEGARWTRRSSLA